MLRSKHISPVKAMLKRSFFKQGFPPNNVDPTLLNFRRSNKSNGHSSAGLHILRHCKKVGNISLNSGPQARFQSEQEGKPTHNRKEIESLPHWLNVGKASCVSCWAFQLAVQIGHSHTVHQFLGQFASVGNNLDPQAVKSSSLDKGVSTYKQIYTYVWWSELGCTNAKAKNASRTLATDLHLIDLAFHFNSAGVGASEIGGQVQLTWPWQIKVHCGLFWSIITSWGPLLSALNSPASHERQYMQLSFQWSQGTWKMHHWGITTGSFVPYLWRFSCKDLIVSSGGSNTAPNNES